MANKFKPFAQKKADDGSEIIVFRDLHHGWFVGKRGDKRFEPQPLGAFITLDVAKQWADRHFDGGDWQLL